MKNFTIVTLIIALITLTGCFDYDENLVINKDGSGTIEMHYAFEEAYLKQMEEMSRQMTQQMGLPPEEAGASSSKMFDKTEIEKALGAEESGIVMTSYEESVTDSVRHYKLNFSFKDINKLYYLYTAVYPDDEEEYPNEGYPGEEYAGQESPDETDEVPPTMFAVQDDGTWLFQREMGDEQMNEEEGGPSGMSQEETEAYYSDDESESGSDDEVDFSALSGMMDQEGMEEALGGLGAEMQGLGEQMQNMAAQMGKHHIRFTVSFPGSVVESNATSFDGNTAVWDLKLDQLQQGLSSMRAVIKR